MRDPIGKRRCTEQLQQGRPGTSSLVLVHDDDRRFGCGRVVAHAHVARDADPGVAVCIEPDPGEVIDVVDLCEVAEQRRAQLVHVSEEPPEASLRRQVGEAFDQEILVFGDDRTDEHPCPVLQGHGRRVRLNELGRRRDRHAVGISPV
jgi:hypothetical protein